ncbi:MAG TPA: helix-turn-helix domain-containing protein [Propionicimonas sp.]|mgnify:CR=1 FL=1|nr:helix-turn-helix domain-containing protein [Propionicimonas sp.]HRA05207.1 helix-turn-helix domain-containing protein [Propionicimonas sp.]
MPRSVRASNRGPAAAASNRRAILAAARELLAEQGYRVPLNAIAKRAGVGQGVLYRHFPSRLDLAYAVFEDNFRELESLAATSAEDQFGEIWRRLIGLTLDSTAFIEMVVVARHEIPDDLGNLRLEELLTEPLAAAQAAGLANPNWTTADVVLILTMVYGAASSASDRDQAASHARRALELLGADSGPTGQDGALFHEPLRD